MLDIPAKNEELVVILAPTGRDGHLIASLLNDTGHSAVSVESIDSLCKLVESGVGAAIVTEEALHNGALVALRDSLSHQPPWSDMPLILLTTSKEADADATWTMVRSLGHTGNITLLERPLRSLTLSSAVEVALRSRRRQYEARTLYEDLERRVDERTSELIAKNLELEGFTYSVSHDMRAPLRAIVSRARIVLEEETAALSTDGVENLQRLSRAAVNMADLVDDLLKYARMGMERVAVETVDLEQLGRQHVDEMDESCSFVYRMEAGSSVRCDPRMMGMAIRNLFDNACKYRKADSDSEIEFGSCTIKNERVFYVRDNGIGFDMRYVDKLFKPFERLHREEYAGTGIGLANVRRVIERHGGRVWAEGSLGEGSTFYFTIP